MTTAIRAYWQRLLVPGLFTIAGLAVLISLGIWQLQRKEWKEGLIATLERADDGKARRRCRRRRNGQR